MEKNLRFNIAVVEHGVFTGSVKSHIHPQRLTRFKHNRFTVQSLAVVAKQIDGRKSDMGVPWRADHLNFRRWDIDLRGKLNRWWIVYRVLGQLVRSLILVSPCLKASEENKSKKNRNLPFQRE